MNAVIYVVFICISIPLLWSLFIFRKKQRLVAGFMLLGGFLCVFAAELNGVLRGVISQDLYYITTNVTPVTEEIIKAIPIFVFVMLFSDDTMLNVELGLSIGLGFAIVENTYIYVQGGASYTVWWALERVVGASLMHALCTAALALFFTFANKRRKFFLTGTFAVLITVMMYHSVFNALIQSSYMTWGMLLPIATFVPLVIVGVKKRDRLRAMRDIQ